MSDALKAIIEFFVDIFSALSKFLGFDIDIGGLTSAEDTENKKDSAAGA